MKIHNKKFLNLTLKPYKTIYIVGQNLLSSLNNIISENYDSFIIISDQAAYSIHGQKVQSALSKTGKKIATYTILTGEKAKDLSQVTEVVVSMLNSGINRNSAIIALGGGVVSDLSGFIASIYQRGIDFICIPTTLLAQIDASIGGKNGVNLALAGLRLKNMLGTFFQPKLVISDVDTLKSLPNAEILNGFGEMVKYYVGWGRPTPSQMQNITPELITECQNIKLKIIESDPFEKTGQRQKLNLGHTLGHAIEAASNGNLSHGQSVSLGLIAAAKISLYKSLLSMFEYQKIEAGLKTLGLLTSVKNIQIKSVLQALKNDKKSETFVLIEKIGKLITGVKVEEEIIIKVLKEIIL